MLRKDSAPQFTVITSLYHVEERNIICQENVCLLFYHHAEMNDPIMQHDCEKLQEKRTNENTERSE